MELVKVVGQGENHHVAGNATHAQKVPRGEEGDMEVRSTQFYLLTSYDRGFLV